VTQICTDESNFLCIAQTHTPRRGSCPGCGSRTWPRICLGLLRGAKVGDLFMSLIHTAELHQVEPFNYLVALLRHAATVALDPAAWIPWNYTATLTRLAAEATGSAPE
jgi:hypothetical protein